MINMKKIEILIISLAVAMDAFSVSICQGLNIKNKFKNSLIIALSFSLFQMLMPLIGYFFGKTLNTNFLKFNNLIAFIFLITIGFNMIKESYNNKNLKIGLNFKELILLSIITSIDAMSVGLTFSFFSINLLFTILEIGIITFILSLIGVNLGNLINNLSLKSEIIGGIILILLSLKFLFEYFK